MMLEQDPPQGDPIGQTVVKCFKDTFLAGGIPENHGPFVVRSWIALMIGFVYACTLDGYGGACAVTVVFMMSTNVAPDIASTLNVLTASTIASVVGGSIIYERVCSTGSGGWLLPFSAFAYWWFGLYVHFSGCKYASIGLLMAALSPFVLVVQCPDPDDVSGTGGAVAMWVGIRGFMMALFIVSMAEYLSTGSKTLAVYAQMSLAEGLQSISNALDVVMDDENPAEALGPASKALGDAAKYSQFATYEPRMWKCKWKHGLLTEVANLGGLMRLDILFVYRAMTGTGAAEATTGCFDYLEKTETWATMKADIKNSLENAIELALALLKHEMNEFKEFPDDFDTENLDTLDGYEEAVEGINKVEGVAFPSKDTEIATLEDDMLVKLSIIFVMLNYMNLRFAAVSRACVRES